MRCPLSGRSRGSLVSDHGVTSGMEPDHCFEHTPCLFCERPNDDELYPASFGTASFSAETFSARRSSTREHYRIIRCRECGLVRSDPILTEDALNSLYAESSFTFSSEAPFAAATYSKLLKKLLHRHGVKQRSLVELGASTGFFLEEALRIGFDTVLGFEPSRHCCDHASPAVRPYLVNDIFRPELLDGKQFDVACSFQVIDHLVKPLEALKAVTASLVPGGCVLLVCHDAESLSARLLGRNSPMIDIEHIHLFSRATIARLCRDAGLSVLESGSLANCYPLGYWLRMVSLTRPLAGLLPESVLRMPLELKAGNLYIFAQKEAASC